MIASNKKVLNTEGGRIRRFDMIQGMGLIHSLSQFSGRESLNKTSRSSNRRSVIHVKQKHHLSQTSSAMLNQDSSSAPVSKLIHTSRSFDSEAPHTTNTTPSSHSDNVVSDYQQPFSIDVDNTDYEEKIDDESDKTSTTRYRSRSPALPCMPPKRNKYHDHCDTIINDQDDEYSIAHAELMYSQATWRMYDRIMTARRRAAYSRASQEETPSSERGALPFQRVPHPANLNEHSRHMLHPVFNESCEEFCSDIDHLQQRETYSTNNDLDRSCRSDSNDFDNAPILFSLEMES